MRIHKNDTVKIITGKDKGKTGKVLACYLKKHKILIENLNMFKKHRRPKKQGEKGEVVSVARPMDISNVMLVCAACNHPTRIGYRSGDTKTRYCKKCKTNI